jgi:hypothetical protein
LNSENKNVNYAEVKMLFVWQHYIEDKLETNNCNKIMQKLIKIEILQQIIIKIQLKRHTLQTLNFHIPLQFSKSAAVASINGIALQYKKNRGA